MGVAVWAVDSVVSLTKAPMDSPAFPAAGQDLAAQIRQGSAGAFERLYQSQGARLKSIAYHLLGNRPDAEDAVQETFLKVYRSIGTYHGQAAFSSWVYRILVNTCTDVRRGRKRRAEEPDNQQRGRESSVALKIALERALVELNPKHRTVFLLAEVEGLKHSEIAEILEIPEGTSKNWLFEAKQALKRALARREKGQ